MYRKLEKSMNRLKRVSCSCVEKKVHFNMIISLKMSRWFQPKLPLIAILLSIAKNEENG